MTFPRLSSLGFHGANLLDRRNYLGGSDANKLMSGEQDQVLSLYKEKCGLSEPLDLSGVLAVVMGQWTEDLNAQWYEMQTKDVVTNRNEKFTHEDIKYMVANVDGICQGGNSIFEAKHVSSISNMDSVLERYAPQLQHNMYVTGKKQAVLSVFKGTTEWFDYYVDADELYQKKLLEVERKFWECVQTQTPPFDLPVFVKPPPFDSMRTVDMTGSNAWADAAALYLENKNASKIFEANKKKLKDMVEIDVREAFGHGVSIRRNRAGWLMAYDHK